MTAIALRILLYALIAGAIYLGVRRIWRDWRKQFKTEDEVIHKRDLEERKRPDVITLKRDKDGTYRPPDQNGN
jgi:hypothetical protein